MKNGIGQTKCLKVFNKLTKTLNKMTNSIKNLKRALKYAKDMGFDESEWYCIIIWKNEITMQGTYDGRELIGFEPIANDGFRRHFGLIDGLSVRIALD